LRRSAAAQRGSVPLDPRTPPRDIRRMLPGRCLCGDVRYEVTAPLGPIVHCHCAQCRRATGTAFATNASVPRAAHRVVAGGELIREYESSPGKYRAFCSRCGSPVYSRSDGDPEALRIRLGSLEQDPGGRPMLHVWTEAKAPWFEITDGLPQIAAPR
jgi:hypothetical protein